MCPDPFLLPRTKGLVPRLSITLELIFCAFSEEETLTVYALGSNVPDSMPFHAVCTCNGDRK